MSKKQARLKSKASIPVSDVLVEMLSLAGLAALLLLIGINVSYISPDAAFLSGIINPGWPLYGNKSTLLLLGSVAVISYLALTLLTLYPQHLYYPVQINQYNAERQYQMMQSVLRWLKLEIMLFILFLAVIFNMLRSGILEEFNPSNILIFIFLIIVTIGIYRHRVKRYNKRHQSSTRPS